MRNMDLIRILIVFRLEYLETRVNEGSYTYSYCFSAWIFGNTCKIRILFVLLLSLGLDIWKPVRTKDLMRILIVFWLGYLETRAN